MNGVRIDIAADFAGNVRFRRQFEQFGEVSRFEARGRERGPEGVGETRNAAGGAVSNRIQTFDSTFSLEPTDATILHFNSTAVTFPSQKGVKAFNDLNQYYNPARPTMGVINRKIDNDIITALETGTQDTGTAATMSLSLAMYGIAILGNNSVPMDGNISCLITPGAYAYLMQTKEFTNVDYVNNKPFENGMTMFRWAGVNWIVHPNLSGKGTNAEKCIMYHRSAIGHACDMTYVQTAVGYDDEQDYSFARCSTYMGSKLLQNSGVVIINHDGSAFAAQ